ncbi:MAG: ribosomal protein S18-alanine N-acetyltransferase [Burkholderiaceae bacterium]
MTAADLDVVCELEKRAYAHPWSRRHFQDSLGAGHPVVMLLGEAGPDEEAMAGRPGQVLLGYMVTMRGVDEVHLLNITVSPDHRRQGWARLLLEALALWSRGQGAQCVWLEVRESNAPARALYDAFGFTRVGVRKDYYPDGHRGREAAIVMSLRLDESGGERTE